MLNSEEKMRYLEILDRVEIFSDIFTQLQSSESGSLMDRMTQFIFNCVLESTGPATAANMLKNDIGDVEKENYFHKN